MKVLFDHYYRLMLSLVSGEMEIWSDCSIVYLFDPGPYLGTCGPCDRTWPPNLKGPQNIRYTLDIVM